MGRTRGGVRVWVMRKGRGVQRPRQWLPKRSCYFIMELARVEVLLLWKPHAGIWPLSWSPKGSVGDAGRNQYPNLETKTVKKLNIAHGTGAPAVPMPNESVVLKKFPRLLAFLTDTVYEDGSNREPGYMWLKNDGQAFEITLFEPSGPARARIRATLLDELLALAERFLGSEAPSWEVDRYLLEKQNQKKKK